MDAFNERTLLLHIDKEFFQDGQIQHVESDSCS